MIARTSKSGRARRGAHAVEFAVALPVFLVFLWGIVDLGRGFMVSSVLTHAARAGCRAGVLPNATTADVRGAVTAALNATSVSGTTTTVLVNGTHKSVTAAQPQDQVTVTVSVPVSKVSWLPGAGYVKGTLTGQFTLPHE
jgi:Flp pilus assembly protein TadG